MPANPPENMPRITPYLYYQDVAAALDWLSRTFGLRERLEEFFAQHVREVTPEEMQAHS